MTLLLPSRTTAVICVVSPSRRVLDAALTVTNATGAATMVTPREPVLPSIVAVIVAGPAATPLTRPLLLTVAVAALDVVHVTVFPVSVLPFASRAVAESCAVCPTEMSPEGAETSTVATAGGPEDSPPPHATVNASVHRGRSASRMRFMLSVPAEAGVQRRRNRRRSNLGRDAGEAKGNRGERSRAHGLRCDRECRVQDAPSRCILRPAKSMQSSAPHVRSNDV